MTISMKIKTVCLAVAGIMGLSAQAETYTWQGGDVFTSSNWSPATEGAESAVPTVADNIIYDRAEVFTLDSTEGKTLESATFTAGALATGIHVTTNALADGTVATNTLKTADRFLLNAPEFTISGGGIVDAAYLTADASSKLMLKESTFSFLPGKKEAWGWNPYFQIKDLTVFSNAVVKVKRTPNFTHKNSRICLLDGGTLTYTMNGYNWETTTFESAVLAITNAACSIDRQLNLKNGSSIQIGENGVLDLVSNYTLSTEGVSVVVDGEGAKTSGGITASGKNTRFEIRNGGSVYQPYSNYGVVTLSGENSLLLLDHGTMKINSSFNMNPTVGSTFRVSNESVCIITPGWTDGCNVFIEGTNSLFRVETGSIVSNLYTSTGHTNRPLFLGSHTGVAHPNGHVDPYAPTLSIADDAFVYTYGDFYAQSDDPDEAARPILEFELTEKTKAAQSLLTVSQTATLSNLVVKVDVEKGKGLSGLYKLMDAKTLKVAGVNIGTATDEARAEALDALVASAQLANGVTLEFGADKKSLYARVKKQGFSIIIR